MSQKCVIYILQFQVNLDDEKSVTLLLVLAMLSTGSVTGLHNPQAVQAARQTFLRMLHGHVATTHAQAQTVFDSFLRMLKHLDEMADILQHQRLIL